MTSTDIVELSSVEKSKRKKPDICICACRPDGDRTGAVKALYMFCENAIINKYRYKIWLQKEEGIDAVCKASEIKTIIDKFVLTGEI